MNWNGEHEIACTSTPILSMSRRRCSTDVRQRQHVLRLLLVGRARQLVGEPHRRLAVAPEDVLHHVVGGRVVDVAVNVDAEVPAATL